MVNLLSATCRLKVFTSQLLRGAFNTLMGVIRDEAAAGLHICALSPEAFCHFFRLALWFLQHCRYQEQARVASKDPKCALAIARHVQCDVPRDSRRLGRLLPHLACLPHTLAGLTISDAQRVWISGQASRVPCAV